MRHHQRHVEKERVRIVWREGLRLGDLHDGLIVMAQIAAREARKAPSQRQVRVQRQRPFVQRTRLLGALIEKSANMTDQRQCAGITWIHGYRPASKLARPPGCSNWVLRPG